MGTLMGVSDSHSRGFEFGYHSVGREPRLPSTDLHFQNQSQ